MSLPRKSKLVVNGTDRPRAHASAAEASGDSLECTTRPHHGTHSRSKNKIPKSVRYDLENALIGLCDVWFEDIKPHLVRHNIKLHVQGSAGGDYSRPPPAPPARVALPPPPATAELPAVSTPACSHLDPGAAYHPRRAASYAGSSSALPGTARSRSSRHTPDRPPLSPLLSVPQTPRENPQIQKANCGANIRRKRRRPYPRPQPSWRVPRLCHTYTVLQSVKSGAGSPMRITSQPPQPRDDYRRSTVPRRVMKNKTTQTEQALCVSRACQYRSPDYRRPTTFTLEPSHNRASFPPTLPLHKISELKRPAVTIAEKSPLFQDDLIDIIAASNDKRLKLLYRCSERNDNLSSMSLFPKNRQQKSALRKIPPWR